MEHSRMLDPSSGKSDKFILELLPSIMNWKLKRRGYAYVRYLENRCKHKNFDKDFVIQRIILYLIIAFERCHEENGLPYAIELMDACLIITDISEIRTDIHLACRVVAHSSRCSFNYKLGNYEEARLDYVRGTLNLSEISRKNKLFEIEGIKALVMFELRTEKSVKEAKSLIKASRLGGTPIWFWKYMYLRIIRHQRMTQKRSNQFNTEERTLIMGLIITAGNCNDILRLVILYRRDYSKVMEEVRYYNDMFLSTHACQCKALFIRLMTCFRKREFAPMYDLSGMIIPIPQTRTKRRELVQVLQRCCLYLQWHNTQQTRTFKNGRMIERISPLDILDSQELQRVWGDDFESDMRATALKVIFGQQYPIQDLQFILERYQEQECQMIVLLNLAYCYYFDQQNNMLALFFWFQALTVNERSPLLRNFRPKITRNGRKMIPDIKKLYKDVFTSLSPHWKSYFKTYFLRLVDHGPIFPSPDVLAAAVAAILNGSILCSALHLSAAETFEEGNTRPRSTSPEETVE